MTSKMAIEELNKLVLQFEKRGGLLPTIAQEASSGQILMLGYSNKEAFEKTIRTKKATFWSTSRNELWTKGETSGDFLEIVNILVDCDQDSLIYKVNVLGSGCCHTKNEDGKSRKSCFYRELSDDFLLNFLEK